MHLVVNLSIYVHSYGKSKYFALTKMANVYKSRDVHN